MAFNLQEVVSGSTPDAAFWSRSGLFKVYLEVKTGCDFSELQLQNHLSDLASAPYQARALVLVSDSLLLPAGFDAFRRRSSGRGVTVSALSWTDLSSWVRKVSTSDCGDRVRFLAWQFAQYIDEEIRPALP
jgi:hypothetical protein